MSFFGFDPSGPKSKERNNDGGNKPLDFDDTYGGLGDYEQEEGDYLNAETFGADVELGNDFDFGHSESNQSGASATIQQPSHVHRSYVAAASQGVSSSNPAQLDTSIDLKPMESLWTAGEQEYQQEQQPQQPQVMSMEDIERQQRQMQMAAAAHQQAPSQQGFMQMPPPPHNFPMQGLPPQQPYQQDQPNSQFVNQYPPHMIPPPAMQGHPNQFQQMPPMFNHHQSQIPNPNQHYPQMYPTPPPNFQEHHGQQQQPQLPLQPPQPPQQGNGYSASPQTLPQPQLAHQQVSPPTTTQIQTELQPPAGVSRSILASPQSVASPRTESNVTSASPQPLQQEQQEHYQVRSPEQQLPVRNIQKQMQQRREPLTPEEQKRLQVRHAKVEKIMKHSGVMTPRDKDFITRYQLSQIVTDDPYNEDFYFQVYKIIQRGGIVGGESNKGSIARAYLEHSGHRLGGRYKRADIALQRMQSQVEKAVTVAKERPQKNKDNVEKITGREGVLGKISSAMNSKAPRRQLLIPSHKASRISNEDELQSLLLASSASPSTSSLDGTDEHNNSHQPVDAASLANVPALEDVTQHLGNVEISQNSKSRRRSSYAFTSVDQNSVLSRSGGRKFVLSLIETVYREVLELEANLRSGKEINNTLLWEALHVDDDIYEVCPFISMLTFDKGVKIMPRIFNFLDKKQKLKLLQTFFSELSHLNIIIISSYKTNPTPTDNQLKKIDLFQTVFLKIIVSFLSNNSNFIEIMGLLLHLIKNNNVSFISTSKIGLNLITVLISRAALIRQDSNRSNGLSSPEISAWNEIYDKLFTALESKLASVFPPQEYLDKVLKVMDEQQQQHLPHYNSGNSPSNVQFYDQSYIWQFLASLALSGKLNHQRIIIDEVREEIFGTINAAEELLNSNEIDKANATYRREKLYQDLNLFLNVMGLVSRDGEISELK
ncbi:deadenylation-dependent mRNA-decapping factor PAT1 NDAI_0I00140 [Naumovozyma dairenensis CBS 421]|uniref:mRNA decay factor PAT1 domain-containing protein n=1 Tax=Naumovozyma dairenensis (strain ATCC 10597 / BCRC 20456 / CBS 421 / NBRC 0211 / NRRL Y-12639) TaxID=1071378 RepID=G0WFM2_NAUDC|nr:hypothetical protein NDAI_0I00140 [Naumovozyma dairenensis CBS 421]CCD26583.1 hypothetical protein NDAI_0I00140 [Naumovozyma dairenensis CBS 421]